MSWPFSAGVEGQAQRGRGWPGGERRAGCPAPEVPGAGVARGWWEQGRDVLAARSCGAQAACSLCHPYCRGQGQKQTSETLHSRQRAPVPLSVLPEWV